jgi:hypothetical protein
MQQVVEQTADLVDSDVAVERTEWRLLGAVERYKACCEALGETPLSRDAWLVFLAELGELADDETGSQKVGLAGRCAPPG